VDHCHLLPLSVADPTADPGADNVHDPIALQPGLADPSTWELPDFVCDVFAPRRTRYCLVIPVINEGGKIGAQLDRIRRLDAGIDVIVADGGSTDGSVTPEVLRAAGVRALLTKTSPGRLSTQLRMAYSWALQEGYDGIVTIDGNGKDGVEAITAFMARLDQGYDYVQGSRYLRGGQAINTPRFRWFSGRFIHAPLVSLAARHWFTDTTNGFRAYSRRYLLDERLRPFRDVFVEYNLLFYLSARASRLGYRVTEIPVSRAYPPSGQVPTKITGWSGKVRLLAELLRTVAGRYSPR